MPHPQVTIRNPPLLPFVPFSATLATTPQPSRVSMPVPKTSERKTNPRDIFDSSIFCCQSFAMLKDGCAATATLLVAAAGPGPAVRRTRSGPGARAARPGRRDLYDPGSGDEAVDLDAVVSLEHLLRVVDLGGLVCRIPAERRRQNVGHLVEQLTGDEPAEGEGCAADQDIHQVADLLVGCHVFQLADAEFPGGAQQAVRAAVEVAHDLAGTGAVAGQEACHPVGVASRGHVRLDPVLDSGLAVREAGAAADGEFRRRDLPFHG